MRLPPKSKLARLRAARRLTQRQLADTAGCSKSTVEKVEYGLLPISPDLAQRLERATGVDPGWLWDGDPDSPPAFLKTQQEVYKERADAPPGPESALFLLELLMTFGQLATAWLTAPRGVRVSARTPEARAQLQQFRKSFGRKFSPVAGLPPYVEHAVLRRLPREDWQAMDAGRRHVVLGTLWARALSDLDRATELALADPAETVAKLQHLWGGKFSEQTLAVIRSLRAAPPVPVAAAAPAPAGPARPVFDAAVAAALYREFFERESATGTKSRKVPARAQSPEDLLDRLTGSSSLPPPDRPKRTVPAGRARKKRPR